MSDDSVDFKKNTGIEGIIQQEENDDMIDPSKITLLDLIKVYGEEPTRRGIQYMASLEKANKEYKKSSEDDLLDGLQEWTGEDEPTDDMIEMSSIWKERMKEKGLGLD